MPNIHHPTRPRLLTIRRIRPLLALGTAVVGVTALMIAAGCHGPAASSGAAAPKPPQAAATGGASTGKPSSTISSMQAQDYVGDAACLPCHPAIGKDFAHTGHAATLRVVGPAEFGDIFRIPTELRDPETGYSYRVGVRDGQCVQIAKGPVGEQVTPATLALGSGQSGVTFLGRMGPDQWVTLRLSYYTPLKRWGFSPSQKPGEQPFALPAGQEDTLKDTVTCLLCHATVLRVDEQGVDLKQSRLNIGCERCHGAGREHVETARAMVAGKATQIAPMAPLSARDVNGIQRACGECHAAPALPPGGDFTKLADLPRLQATALGASRCFKESGTLSCLTCHEPHSRLEQRTAAYEAVCLRCHGGGAGASASSADASTPTGAAPVAAVHGRICPVNPKSGCIGCHMPASKIESVSTATFHNHWIRVWRKAKDEGVTR